MTWWIIAAVVYVLAFIFAWSLVKAAGDADRRLEEMRVRYLRESDE